MTDYLFDISRQTDVFAAACARLRQTQPPLLVVAGIRDVIFPEETQRAFVEDVPAAEFHALDTGHRALATHGDEIATLKRSFLDRLDDEPRLAAT